MKTNKLLAAGALALSMAMTPAASLLNAMPMTVMAAEDTDHTITINTDVANATYSAYQIFKGSTLPSGQDTNLANVTWGNGISEAGKTAVYAKYEVETAQEMAEKLTTQAEARAFATFINQYLQNPVNSTTTDGKPVISVKGDGYYLIKDVANSTQAPTESILKVVNDVHVNPKTTDVPDTEKKVVENNKTVTGNPAVVPFETGHKINDVADYNIGDTVPFILAAKTPASTDIASYTNYVFTFHDKMDDGLTLKADSIVVKAGEETLVAGTDYTLNTSPEDNDTFDLVLNIKKDGTDVTKLIDKTITVSFNATLNKNAKLDTVGNQNGFILEYSNNPTTGGTGRTKEDKVVVFTYHLDLDKVDNKESSTKLTGAEFILSRESGENIEYLVAEKITTGEKTGQYTVKSWTKAKNQATTLSAKTEGSSEFVINGLDHGTYKLTETKAPDGYQLPSIPFTITLTAATTNDQGYNGTPSTAIGDIKVNDTVGNAANIENTKGHPLPETGGMGTTMIYGVGAVMVAGAAVFYVTNKRTRKD